MGGRRDAAPLSLFGRLQRGASVATSVRWSGPVTRAADRALANSLGMRYRDAAELREALASSLP